MRYSLKRDVILPKTRRDIACNMLWDIQDGKGILQTAQTDILYRTRRSCKTSAPSAPICNALLIKRLETEQMGADGADVLNLFHFLSQLADNLENFA